MQKTTKLKIAAIILLASPGAIAGIAAYSQQPGERITYAPIVEPDRTKKQEKVVLSISDLEPVKPAKKLAKLAKKKKKRSCHYEESQTFVGTRVKVCDVERTGNRRKGFLFMSSTDRLIDSYRPTHTSSLLIEL